MIDYILSFNFGLTQYAAPTLYATFIFVVLYSIFKEPVAGIFYLAPLIPMQTLRDRLNQFPFGASMVTIVLLAVAIGLMRKGEPLFPTSVWKNPIRIIIVFTFISLLYGSTTLGESVIPEWSARRFEDWRNYASMLFMAMLTASSVKTTKQIKILVGIIAFGILVFDRSFWVNISGRDFSSYSDDLRDQDGGVGYAGVNGFAALEAQAALFLLGLSGYLKFKWKIACLALSGFSALCLMYSLARAGYVALIFGAVILGIIRYRWILALMVAAVVFASTATSLLPQAVIERVGMTESTGGRYDNSSESRLNLWQEALDAATENPLMGTGFNTYAYQTHFRGYQDSHNIYIKVMAETGYIGLALFLWLIFTSLRGGFALFRHGQVSFHKGIGLGLVGWVAAAMAANFFGDRWTFLQVNGYMWMFSGLVAAATTIETEAANNDQVLEDEMDEDTESLELDVA